MRRVYFYALLLLPVALIAAAVGYYKFVMPAGIAAVVNGEEILLSEVDGMMNGAGVGQAPEEMRARMRYAILSDLITERIAWQETRKAGITVSAAEVNDAYHRAQTSSGMDAGDFRRWVSAQYGSEAVFRTSVERRTGIKKYIAEWIAADGADLNSVQDRADRWLREATARSAVRIALSEQAPATGCGCCNRGPGGTELAAGQSVQAREAQRAALDYWRKTRGDSAVDTRLTDYGCHVQVDIIKNKKIARSLRYQNGAITEL